MQNFLSKLRAKVYKYKSLRVCQCLCFSPKYGCYCERLEGTLLSTEELLAFSFQRSGVSFPLGICLILSHEKCVKWHCCESLTALVQIIIILCLQLNNVWFIFEEIR